MDIDSLPSVYSSAVILAVLSLCAILLDIGPLIWHSKNANIAAASLIVWIVILNLASFVNAIIWHNDDTDSWWSGHGLCDVQVKLFVGAYVGLPGALIAIMRNLVNVLNTSTTVLTPSTSQRRRRIIIDLLLCWAFPIYMMLVHYIVQPSRYYLWTVSGCNPSFDNSWVSVVLIFVWPLVFAVIGCVYAILLIVRLRKYRQEFGRLLSVHNTNKSRFMRLFVMSFIMILAITPIQIFVFITNIAVPHHAFSWRGIHSEDWNTIIKVPTGGVVIYDRWLRLACGILVFMFFGTGRDAMTMYRAWLIKLGLGRVFPSLIKPHNARSNTFASSAWAIISGKARLLFSRSHDDSGHHPMTNDSQDSDGFFHKRSHSWLSQGRTPRAFERSVAANGNTLPHSPITAANVQKDVMVIKREIWQETDSIAKGEKSGV